jgi:hypothetical protein
VGEYLASTPLYFADVHDVETGNHRERVVIIKDRDASRPHFGKCDMIGCTNPNHPTAGEFYVKWLERLCVLKSSDLVNHRFASTAERTKLLFLNLQAFSRSLSMNLQATGFRQQTLLKTGKG